VCVCVFFAILFEQTILLLKSPEFTNMTFYQKHASGLCRVNTFTNMLFECLLSALFKTHTSSLTQVYFYVVHKAEY